MTENTLLFYQAQSESFILKRDGNTYTMKTAEEEVVLPGKW